MTQADFTCFEIDSYLTPDLDLSSFLAPENRGSPKSPEVFCAIPISPVACASDASTPFDLQQAMRQDTTKVLQKREDVKEDPSSLVAHQIKEMRNRRVGILLGCSAMSSASLLPPARFTRKRGRKQESNNTDEEGDTSTRTLSLSLSDNVEMDTTTVSQDTHFSRSLRNRAVGVFLWSEQDEATGILHTEMPPPKTFRRKRGRSTLFA
eukprot:3646413-Rhodomonas_salina.1